MQFLIGAHEWKKINKPFHEKQLNKTTTQQNVFLSDF
jgi:hypothetical protein